MLGSTDLTGDTFGLRRGCRPREVQYLSSSGVGQNAQFQDIDVLSGSVPSGQTLALNVIGSASTAKLRYVFPGNFTVASGAKMTVAAGLPVLSSSQGDADRQRHSHLRQRRRGEHGFNNFSSTQQPDHRHQRRSPAQAAARARPSLAATAGGWTSNIIVNGGGQLQATNSTFASSLSS